MINSSHRINVDEALLDSLWRAQLAHTADYITDPHVSDDGLDYIGSALDLASLLTDIYTDNRVDDLSILLNTPRDDQGSTVGLSTHDVPHLADYACDGVCQALYELNCPALPKED